MLFLQNIVLFYEKRNGTKWIDIIEEIRVGKVHRYRNLENKVCTSSTLTSLGTLGDTSYKTNLYITLVHKV